MARRNLLDSDVQPNVRFLTSNQLKVFDLLLLLALMGMESFHCKATLLDRDMVINEFVDHYRGFSRFCVQRSASVSSQSGIQKSVFVVVMLYRLTAHQRITTALMRTPQFELGFPLNFVSTRFNYSWKARVCREISGPNCGTR